jgi:superfamily II DNA or RNA helicase
LPEPTTSYDDFLRQKEPRLPAEGLEWKGDSSGVLFGFQSDLDRWSLRRGRAAIFADTGLGKSLIQAKWGECVSREGKVLILAPLAVAEQTVREGAKVGVPIHYSRDGLTPTAITITNYELLHRFRPEDFAGIVLDESSILKAYDGATRNAIIAAFTDTPFRLACTATPAPNDFTELGNHSEFLGVKSRTEMLSEYFVHDGKTTQEWRLKGHAEDVFWRWVCSWGAMVKRPSDLGYEDGAFRLPPLRMHERIVPVDDEDFRHEGHLFAPQARTLSDQRATRRATRAKRVQLAAELAVGNDPVLIWCELNPEGDALEELIPDAVQVRGSDPIDKKVDRLLGFADGRYRVLVTKPSIAGHGMNWQRCAREIFVGASHSYEQTYQAIRRCWRFGQTRPVDVYVIRAENEEAILANYRRKEADAERMSEAMVGHMRETMREEISSARREVTTYEPREEMRFPAWLESESDESACSA